MDKLELILQINISNAKISKRCNKIKMHWNIIDKKAQSYKNFMLINVLKGKF